MGSKTFSVTVSLLLLFNVLLVNTSQAAVVTVEMDGLNPTLSGSQASALGNVDQLQISYSYYTQSDCSNPCNDALIDVQVHLSNSFDNTSFHWNLGKFSNNGGLSTGQLLISGNSLLLTSSEPIAGDSLNSVKPTYLRLQISGISNLTTSTTPLELPVATAASVCIGDNVDPCVNGNNVVADFAPQFFQRQLPLQWANPLPLGNKITKILWNSAHQQYLAVGHNGSIMSSSNGIAWAMQGRVSAQFNHDPVTGAPSQVIPAYAMFDDINAMVFANDRYVVAGRKFVAVSRFGVDWIYHYRPRGDFLDVAWDSILGSRFVAVGNWVNNQSNIIFSDQYGRNWSDTQGQVLTAVNTRLRKFIAGGDSRYYALNSSDGSILFSGNTSLGLWSTGKSAAQINDIVWDSGNNLAIAVGAKNAIFSGSVSSWTPLTMSTIPNAVFHSITPTANSFLAAGFSISCSNIVEFTLPGTVNLHNWSTTCSNASTPVVFQLAHDGSRYLASTEDRKIYYTNNLDGDWQLLTQGQENDIHAAVFAGGNQAFYAVGNQAYFARSLDDGATWTTLATSPAISAALFGIAADNSPSPLVVAVGEGGTMLRLDESTAAIADTFTEGNDNYRDIEWIGDKFIALGDNNRVMSSVDGLTWNDVFSVIRSSASLAATDVFDFSDVYFANGRLFILGTNRNVNAQQKTVLLQSDQAAANWQLNPSPLFKTSNDLFAMAWSGNTYVISATGDNNDLLLSSDGDNWIRATSGGINDSPISRLLWTGKEFIGIGPLKNSAGGLVYPSWYQSRDGFEWIKTRAPLNFNSGTRAYPLAISDKALVTGGGFGSLLYMFKTFSPSHLAQSVTLPNQVRGQAGTSITIDAVESDAANVATRDWRFIPELSDAVNASVQSSTASLSLTLPEVPLYQRPNNANMVLRYSVVDKQGATSSAQVNVEITPSNQKPVINSLQSNSGVNVVEGEVVTLTASVSDPDGDTIVTQQWTVASGPSVNLSSCVNQLECQFIVPAVTVSSQLVIEYHAVDSLGAGAVSSISLNITPNQAPQINMPAGLSIREGQTAILDGVIVSDDAPINQLRMVWEVDVAGSDFNPATAVIMNPLQLHPIIVAPSLPVAQASTLSLRLTVTDHLNKSATATMLVTITPLSLAGGEQFPQANAGADIPSAGQILAGSKIVLDGSATSDSNNRYDYEWYFAGSFASNGTAIDLPNIDIVADTAFVQKASFVSPVSDVDYYLVFNLRVTDNSLSSPVSSVDSMTVFISAPPQPIDSVDAVITLNGTPLVNGSGEVTGGETIHFAATNLQFKSNQQNVNVGTLDVSQFSFYWNSVNYRFGDFNAVRQSDVNFPPIATVSTGTYQFNLRLCDHYGLVCSDKTIYLVVKIGGFAGLDQIIDRNTKTVVLQFNDNGRSFLDTVVDANGYESVKWEQLAPLDRKVSLSADNLPKVTFPTSGLPQGDYVFRLTYSVLGVANEVSISDEVTIKINENIPAYKPGAAKSNGGAFSIYFLLIPLWLLRRRYRSGVHGQIG